MLADGVVQTADALAEAGTEKPELLFDLATLTGAARTAPRDRHGRPFDPALHMANADGSPALDPRTLLSLLGDRLRRRLNVHR